MNPSEYRVERIRGKGPGGQNKNKVCSCIRLTHLATGIQVTQDGRDQGRNLKVALKELDRRLKAQADAGKAAAKKARRDKAIHDTPTIRTYDFQRHTVKDHRTGKVAPLKKVLNGQIDLLR